MAGRDKGVRIRLASLEYAVAKQRRPCLRNKEEGEN